MTRKTRSTGLLVLFLALAILATIRLLPDASLPNVVLLFAGGLGCGVALGIMIVPQPTRIQRRETGPVRKAKPTRGRGGNGGGNRGGGRSRSGGKPKASSAPRINGTVKWFSDRKGFGFITPENGEEDCFVHRSALKGGTIAEGKRVEFQIIDDDKGRRAATNVKIL